MKLKKGQIVYFYDDTIQYYRTATIIEIFEGYCKLERTFIKRSNSFYYIKDEYIFETELEAQQYTQSKNNKIIQDLKNKIQTPENLLNYMYSYIWNEYDEFISEKQVIREKAKELLNIDIKQENRR